MREMTVEQAEQSFLQVIDAAESGDAIVVTRNGRPVAKVTPQTADRTADPEWRAAFAALRESLRTKPVTGYRVGTISEQDKYGSTSN
jgi:prevent-host-death family protein